VCVSDCPVHCGKTADWIWMPFGLVGRLGPRMRQIVGVGDCSTPRDTFGGECVTNGEFVAYLCESA